MIIPLIDESFTTDDFSKEAGFIDAFDTDINKPYLDNHIFLMYDPNVKTRILEAVKALFQLESHKISIAKKK